jgi:purine nucleosidase
MKVLIDTDPGVDDALAILMAHAHADVVALSIAAGNVGLHHTMANALKLVETIGAATPVFGGCAAPLVQPAEDAGFVHGKDGFGDAGYYRARAQPKANMPRTPYCACRTSMRAISLSWRWRR